MDKLKIKSAQEALAMAQQYLANSMQDVELAEDKNGKIKYKLANLYNTPDYRNKIGGVCYVFGYRRSAGDKAENFRIYVKCSGVRKNCQVKGIKVEDSSMEEIMPGDNFSCLGNRYHYDGNTITLGEEPKESTSIH